MRLLGAVTPEIAQTWAHCLADLSENELRRGLQNAKDFTGYFSVGAFRELCKATPENLGLPSAHSAYVEACKAPQPKKRHKWSHPAVYHAGVETGWFELAQMPENQIFPKFRHNYEIMVRRVMDGESLHVPVAPALEHNPPRFLTAEQNKKRLQAAREALGL